MVVNCMVVAIAMHEERQSKELRIYHVGSSLTNPIKLGQIKRLMYEYCKENPLSHNKGIQQELITFTSISSFQTYIRIHYFPFLAVKFFIFSNLLIFSFNIFIYSNRSNFPNSSTYIMY